MVWSSRTAIWIEALSECEEVGCTMQVGHFISFMLVEAR